MSYEYTVEFEEVETIDLTLLSKLLYSLQA
jgi:hypothetical protein